MGTRSTLVGFVRPARRPAFVPRTTGRRQETRERLEHRIRRSGTRFVHHRR